MSRLSRFQRKPLDLEFNIEGRDEKEILKIKPFKTTDMQLLMDLSNPDKTVEATHIILRKVIKDNIPDYTEEEFNEMSYAYADKILNAVMDINSLDTDERKKKIIEEIRAKQIAAGLIKPTKIPIIVGDGVVLNPK